MMLQPSVAMARAIGPMIPVLHEWTSAGDTDVMERVKQRLTATVRGGEILASSLNSAGIIPDRCTRDGYQDQRGVHTDDLQDTMPHAVLGSDVGLPALIRLISLQKCRRLDRDDLSAFYGGQKGRHARYLDACHEAHRVQPLGAQPRLAGNHPHIQLARSVAQLLQSRHTGRAHPLVARCVSDPRPVGEQRVAPSIRGEQNDAAS
jgi:hypothetical protein